MRTRRAVRFVPKIYHCDLLAECREIGSGRIKLWSLHINYASGQGINRRERGDATSLVPLPALWVKAARPLSGQVQTEMEYDYARCRAETVRVYDYMLRRVPEFEGQ